MPEDYLRCAIGMAHLQFSFLLWLETLLEVVPSLYKSSSGFTTWVGSGLLSCAASRLITATGQALPGHTFTHVLKKSHSRDKLILSWDLRYSLKPTLQASWQLLWCESRVDIVNIFWPLALLFLLSSCCYTGHCSQHCSLCEALSILSFMCWYNFGPQPCCNLLQ